MHKIIIKFIIFVGAIYVCVATNLDITRVDYTTNPNWLNVSMKLKPDASKGINVLDLEAHTFQNLPSKVLFDLTASKDYGNGTYLPTNWKFKLDTCLFMTKNTGNPFFNFYYSNFKKFGRLPLGCPIKVGYYFLKNMTVLPLPGVPFKLSVKYLVKIKIQHVLPSRTKISLANVTAYLAVVE